MRCLAVLALAVAGASMAQITPASMPFTPDLHGDRVVFSAEGDLWLGSRITGAAERLTSWPGVETRPRFSPDGQHIAFTGEQDGGRQVYVIPVGGGQPQRMTQMVPNADVVDWTPDGKRLVVASAWRDPFGGLRLYEVGAFLPTAPRVLPMRRAGMASIHSDGRIAYTRLVPDGNNWNRYRGGQANDIHLYDPAKNQVRKLTSALDGEDWPMWVSDKILYISDIPGTPTLFSLNPATGRSEPVMAGLGGLSTPATDGTRVVAVRGTDLVVVDPAKSTVETLKLRLTSDRIHTRPYETRASIEGFAPSPSGRRVLVEARGQIYHAAANEGDIRPVYVRPGVRARLAQWSPNAKVISFLSDENDEWNLWIVPADGSAAPVQQTKFAKIGIETYQWAPNSLWFAVLDSAGTLWRVDFGSGKTTQIATSPITGSMTFAISPDSNSVVYATGDSFQTSSLWRYDIVEGKAQRLTKPPFRDSQPTFDKNNRWMYFLSERNITQQWDSIDFQLNGGETTQIFAMRIMKEGVNPFLPKVDEETTTPTEEPTTVTFDWEQGAKRPIRLPVPAASISSLQAGIERVFWLQDGALMQFDFRGKRMSKVADGVDSFSLTPSGRQMVMSVDGSLQVVEAGSGPDGKPVPLTAWTLPVVPKEEWRQSLREGWRYIRDNFYDPNLHGADWPLIWKRLEAQLPAVGHRSELTRLIAQMQGEVQVSHMFAGGGEFRFRTPSQPGGPGSLLADFEWDGKVWRIAKLLESDGYELESRSPLLEPGVEAKVGDAVTALNDQPLGPDSDWTALLSRAAGRMMKLTIEGKPVWVRATTAGMESLARYFDWTETRRAEVERASAGKFGYVHVPDMGNSGMTEFSKHFYAALDKDALIIDVRDNGGGITNGMILERLKRVIYEYDQGRYGAPVPYHRTGFNAKVVVIANEGTASDGEYFCEGFRYQKLGPVVGMRTWAGFVAVGGISTIDGGFISCPVQGSFFADGRGWLKDGTGFVPDYLVEEDPLSDRDTQLAKAIEVAKELVRKDPPKRMGRQTPPKRTR